MSGSCNFVRDIGLQVMDSIEGALSAFGRDLAYIIATFVVGEKVLIDAELVPHLMKFSN